jgi:D-arabinono-1,4-lactone oxidase
MTINAQEAWDKAAWWVRLYSIITIVAVSYGIIVAHLPFLIGHPWSSCETCPSTLKCALVFHLFEIPMVGYHAFFAWYGLKRYRRGTVNQYLRLLTTAISVSLVFFLFEIVLLLENVKSTEHGWEYYALSSVALILVGGAGLGVAVGQKILTALYPTTGATDAAM